MKQKRTRIMCWLNTDDEQRLRKIAEQRSTKEQLDITAQDLIRQAVKTYLERKNTQ